MVIGSSMKQNQLGGAAARSGRRADAFADPLEGAEWDGLRWSLPLLSFLVAGERPVQGNAEKIKKVQRFTAPAATKSVCVS